MSKQSQSNEAIVKRFQQACINNIQWLIDDIQLINNTISIRGWAIVSQGNIDEVMFFINGEEFDHVEYPISSPDLQEIFWSTSHSRRARFNCSKTVSDHVTNSDFICLEFCQQKNRDLAKKTAWYIPGEKQNINTPESDRIQRVIGTSNLNSYLMGGATIFNRLNYYLQDKYSKTLTNFETVLDWGCGSGRVARHFNLSNSSSFFGVDIDEDNISWCQKNLSNGYYSTIPLSPPTSLPDNHFELIVGFSVLTHLDEENQFDWLKELKRISKKDGLVMLSVEGLSQAGLYRPPAEIIRRVESEGFVVVGNNFDLDKAMGENNHYLNVIQSRKYIQKKWGEYFTIVDIVDAIAANQDLVVMKNDLV